MLAHRKPSRSVEAGQYDPLKSDNIDVDACPFNQSCKTTEDCGIIRLRHCA